MNSSAIAPVTDATYAAALAAAPPQHFTERDADTGQITGVYGIDQGTRVYVARWAVA